MNLAEHNRFQAVLALVDSKAPAAQIVAAVDQLQYKRLEILLPKLGLPPTLTWEQARDELTKVDPRTD